MFGKIQKSGTVYVFPAFPRKSIGTSDRAEGVRTRFRLRGSGLASRILATSEGSGLYPRGQAYTLQFLNDDSLLPAFPFVSKSKNQ